MQRGVWGNFPRYNPEIVSRQTGKGSREAPPLAPASCLHPSCKMPAAAAPPQSADAAHLCHPNLSSCATRRAPDCSVSAAERSAAAGFLQEMKRQESGGDPKKLRPRRRQHLICNEGSGETSPDTTPKILAVRKSKEVAKPLPLLLSPVSTPPVRRPRQRPSQISVRGAPLPPQSFIQRHPPRARMFFLFRQQSAALPQASYRR